MPISVNNQCVQVICNILSYDHKIPIRNCQSSQWINRLWDWYRSRVEMNIVLYEAVKEEIQDYSAVLSVSVPATVPSVYFPKRVKMWLKAVELPLVQYPLVIFRKKPLKIFFFPPEKVSLLSSGLPHVGFLCLSLLSVVFEHCFLPKLCCAYHCSAVGKAPWCG